MTTEDELKAARAEIERLKAELNASRQDAVDLYRRRRVMHRDTPERGREVISFDEPEEWLAEHDEKVRAERDAHWNKTRALHHESPMPSWWTRAELATRDARVRAAALEEAAKTAECHALKWQSMAVNDLDKANEADVDSDHVWRRDAHQHKCMGSVGIDIAAEIRALATPAPAASEPSDMAALTREMRERPAAKCMTCGGDRRLGTTPPDDCPDCAVRP